MRQDEANRLAAEYVLMATVLTITAVTTSCFSPQGEG